MLQEQNEKHESMRRDAQPAIRRLRSSDLFAGAAEVLIEHEGREYRLRVTRNGKLILTA